MIYPCVSTSRIEPHDVVEATGLLKMRGGVGKGADAKRVTAWAGLGGRAENQRASGKSIP